MSFHSKLYNGLILPGMLGSFHVLAPFVSKIGEGLRQRQGLLDRVSAFRHENSGRELLLFHCASAGEFESLRPLAREFDRSRFLLAVSYFSPSARAAADKSTEFDFVDCSPIDTPRAVDFYLDALRPSCICITKHDLWPNFVWRARSRTIPCFLISGNFHPRSLKLLPGSRSFHRSVYNALTEIMTVSEDDSRRAAELCGKSARILTVGDTRYDRVLQRARSHSELPARLEQFCRGKSIFVIGSSHPDDENLLLPVLKKFADEHSDFAALIIPHDPSPAAARRIRTSAVLNSLSLCDLDAHDASLSARLMIVNRTGILADLYRLGAVAYVGGGFGKGVHSVLEPLSHGLPVITGPNISVSNEANLAEHEGLLRVVTGRKQVAAALTDWTTNCPDPKALRGRCIAFVDSRSGATRIIAQRLLDALVR